jgi:hypothetical protein
MAQSFSYQDAVDHLIDYLAGGPSDAVVRDCRRAARAALDDLVNAHNWTYLYKIGRVNTVAPYSEGTIEYDADDRIMTLTDGVWPAWSSRALVRVGSEVYRAEQRLSDTGLLIDETLRPGAAIDADTTYTVYQDSYQLPFDYVSQDQSLYQQNFGCMSYVHPRDWVYGSRYILALGTPQYYTVTGDETPGRMCISVHPTPADGMSIDFLYKRRPRQPVENLSSGTCDVTTGSQTLEVAASTFKASDKGRVVRLYTSSSPTPSSPIGANPPVHDTFVEAVSTNKEIILSDASPITSATAHYTIADPIDIELGSMLAAYLRGCERQVAISRGLKNNEQAEEAYKTALLLARDADSRSFARRSASTPGTYLRRLRDFPAGPDEP